MCAPGYNLCQNGAACQQLGANSVNCGCVGPWSGTYCNVYVSPCTKMTCLNGGVCQDVAVGVASCACVNCYTGTVCETKLDVCRSSNGVSTCLNGGFCQASPTSCAYNCTCQPGRIEKLILFNIKFKNGILDE